MDPRTERILRWFVGLSLLAGGLLLLAGGLQYGTLIGAAAWVVPLAAIVAAALALFTAFAERGLWPAMAPAAAWILSVLVAILWAHLDPKGSGHVFLSGYAAIVAFATGIGFLRRQLWAWPVGLASVVGFGPIVLILAPLSADGVAAGFVLFSADVLALLAVHRSYFSPR